MRVKLRDRASLRSEVGIYRTARHTAALRAFHTGDDDLDLDLTRLVFELPAAAESSSLHLYISFLVVLKEEEEEEGMICT